LGSLTLAPLSAAESSEGPRESVLAFFRRERLFGAYLLADTLSAVGSWAALTAEALLVLRLGGDGVALGVTTGLQTLPLLVVGWFTGSLVERVSARRLTLMVHIGSLMTSGALGFLVLGGMATMWLVWLFALLTGLAVAVGLPASQLILRDFVSDAGVPRAVGFNFAVTGTARTVGPAVAGLVIAAGGLGWCFLVDAATFVPVIVIVWRLSARSERQPAEVKTEDLGFRAGLRYVRRAATLKVLLIVLFVVGLLGFNFRVLLPLAVASGGPSAYSVVMVSLGFGTLVGSLVAGWLAQSEPRYVLGMTCAFGAVLGIMAGVQGLEVVYVTAGLMGVVYGLLVSGYVAALQRESGDAFRGRVMTLYSIAFVGTTPVGGPLIGLVAERWSPGTGFLVGSLACSVSGFAGLVCLRPGEERAGYPEQSG
jgi:MFS family permease